MGVLTEDWTEEDLPKRASLALCGVFALPQPHLALGKSLLTRTPVEQEIITLSLVPTTPMEGTGDTMAVSQAGEINMEQQVEMLSPGNVSSPHSLG